MRNSQSEFLIIFLHEDNEPHGNLYAHIWPLSANVRSLQSRTCHCLRHFVFTNKCSKKWKKVLTNICLLGIMITNGRSKVNKNIPQEKKFLYSQGNTLVL